MIEPAHLVQYVIRPVLKDLELWAPKDENIVLGTGCVETECGRWLRQLGDGPARGIYQMEPDTAYDIMNNYLPSKPKLKETILSYCGDDTPWEDELVWNLRFATAMCRVHYLRVPEPIPDTVLGQAAYWKQYYNTPQGAGTVEDYIAAWRRFVPAELVLV